MSMIDSPLQIYWTPLRPPKRGDFGAGGLVGRGCAWFVLCCEWVASGAMQGVGHKRCAPHMAGMQRNMGERHNVATIKADDGEVGRAMRPVHWRMIMNMQALQGKSQAELLAIISQMQADTQRKLSCKVSEKGGVSVYGLGRWPVTLYKSQWEALLAFAKSGAIERFIEANASLLSVKQ